MHIRQSPQHARVGRGKSTALPGNSKNTAQQVPEQNSATESSDWRFVTPAVDNEPRSLTAWLQRAVSNAAGRKVGKSEIAAAPSRAGTRRHVDLQAAAIVDDVDDEPPSIASFSEMPYPVYPGYRGPLPAAPPVMHRNAMTGRAGVPEPRKHTPQSRGNQAGQHSGYMARSSPGIIRSFYHVSKRFKSSSVCIRYDRITENIMYMSVR